MLLPQVVTEIPCASLVLHAQLVAALATVDDAVEQRLPVARHATGFVAVVLGVVIAQHLLNPLICRPRDIRRIPVANDDPPLAWRQQTLSHFSRVFGPNRPRAAIHERAGVGWIFHHRTEVGNSRTLPLDSAIAVTARDAQVLATEVLNDPGQRLLLQQGVEDEPNPVPDLLIRMFLDATIVASHQSRRQGER